MTSGLDTPIYTTAELSFSEKLQSGENIPAFMNNTNSIKQKTIQQEIEISGHGLHTGNFVTLRLIPAGENAGINFIRTDLPDRPVIKIDFENVVMREARPRCSSLKRGEVVIHTVEHLMSTLCGLGIDNLTIEIDNNELPGLDGSGLQFLKAIKDAGVKEQNAEKEYIDIQEPIGVSLDGASILLIPDKEFKISYTLDYDHPFLRSQFFSTVINTEIFESKIAPCRTFCLEREAEQLAAKGLGKGANYKNTLVVGETGVIDNEVRFPDEFARHKVLDFIGDLYLLGKPIRGHAFAIKSGHQLNMMLLKKIYKQKQEYAKSSFLPDPSALEGECPLDIGKIMRMLPHRYPFLLVDKIISLEKGKKIVGLKNVTINENFFQGHFPSRPIMPGVLIVEALAQVGGVLVLTSEIHHGKVAVFMAADKVKFRGLVEPGEQLVLEVEVIRDRSRTSFLKGQAKVNGKVVTEVEYYCLLQMPHFWTIISLPPMILYNHKK